MNEDKLTVFIWQTGRGAGTSKNLKLSFSYKMEVTTAFFSDAA